MNNISIEGLTWESELQALSLNECKIFDYSVKIPINTPLGIKDIYQVSLSTALENKRIINLKNSNILLLKGITNYKILSVENSPENNINYLEEKTFFNASFTNTNLNEECIDVYIIDANFNLITNYEIDCSLTYLFVFKGTDLVNTEDISTDLISTYKLIDITKEFN